MQFKILLIFFVLSFFILPAFSQTPLISIQVSNNTFEEGDTVVISGSVATVIGETPVIIQIFQETNLVHIAQLEVAKDGSFTYSVIAKGQQWQVEGLYVVRASYGDPPEKTETDFEFFKKQEIIGTSNIFEVDAGSYGTFDVEYSIRGGTVTDMIVDSEVFALIVIIESSGDGSITINLPRESIDAKKSDSSDDVFIILIDGTEVPYQESKMDVNSRTITIEFEEGDSDIEIIGTFVIPEFGTMTSLVLAGSIISIIIISSKRNLVKI